MSKASAAFSILKFMYDEETLNINYALGTPKVHTVTELFIPNGLYNTVIDKNSPSDYHQDFSAFSQQFGVVNYRSSVFIFAKTLTTLLSTFVNFFTQS